MWLGDDSSSSSGGGIKAAGQVPAVQLAEAVGRAVNSRLKYLRFKYEQHQLVAQQPSDAADSSRDGISSGSSSSTSGVDRWWSALDSDQQQQQGQQEGHEGHQVLMHAPPALMHELETYCAAAASDAGRYAAGQSRLAALLASHQEGGGKGSGSRLKASTKRSVLAAQVCMMCTRCGVCFVGWW